MKTKSHWLVLLVVAALLAGAGQLAAAPLMQSKDMMPDDSSYKGRGIWEINKIDDNLYTFRWEYHRTIFVVTSEGVIVGDPLNPRAAAKMVEKIKEITDAPIRYVIYSHDHLDHTWGAQPFKDVGATILAHETATRAIHARLVIRPDPEWIRPDISWTGYIHRITLGGVVLELRYYGKDHGSGMTTYYFPQKKLIHLADIISPNRLPAGAMPDMYPSQIQRSLEEIAKLDFDTVIAAHEPYVTYDRSCVDDMARFYADMFDAVDRAVNKLGRTTPPWIIVPAVERTPQYSHWNHYEDWHYMVASRFVLERVLGY